MNSSYSSVDWVLSHWAHFIVRIFICVYLRVFCVFFLILHVCFIIVTRWNEPDEIGAWSLGPICLQCIDTVGFVI